MKALASDRMNMETENDLHYIRLVLNGNIEKFLHLVRRYDKMVFTTINKIVQRKDLAEDLTQEVFIKVFKSLDRFQENSEFSTWLYRIAYNTTISELRKKEYKHYQLEINYDNIADTEIDDTIEYIDTETQLKHLNTVLASMPKEDALLITLFYFNEQTIKQISQISGYTESNIKVKLHRIRKFMNYEINKLMENE